LIVAAAFRYFNLPQKQRKFVMELLVAAGCA